MANDTILIAEPRAGKGSASSRNLRREGVIPGVVYSSHVQPTSIQLNTHKFEMLLHHHKSEHLILDLKIGDDEVKKVLLKDIQHHTVSGDILHVDFQEISMTETMTFIIGIELKGEPIGVKQGGGILEQMLREIEVECLPTDLVETIDIDVSGLNVGDSLLVRDIVIDSKLTLVTDGEVAVAIVAAPKAEVEAEVAAVVGEGAVPVEGGEVAAAAGAAAGKKVAVPGATDDK